MPGKNRLGNAKAEGLPGVLPLPLKARDELSREPWRQSGCCVIEMLISCGVTVTLAGWQAR